MTIETSAAAADTQDPAAPAERLTIADVRAAIGNTDPNKINAAKLRQIIGRGGFTTIQKHLDAIRAELVPPAAAPATAVTPPTEHLTLIWQTAYAAAAGTVSARLLTVTQERDAARDALSAQTADIESLTAELDTTNAAAAEATRQAIEATAALTEHADALAAKEAALLAAVAQAQAQTEQVRAEAAAAAAAVAAAATLAERDHTIAMQAIQQIVDRQSTEVGQLRSLLDRLTAAPAPDLLRATKATKAQ